MGRRAAVIGIINGTGETLVICRRNLQRTNCLEPRMRLDGYTIGNSDSVMN